MRGSLARPVAVTMVLGLLVTAGATMLTASAVDRQRDERFATASQQLRVSVQTQLDTMEAIAIGLRNSLRALDVVTPAGFQAAMVLGDGDGLYDSFTGIAFARPLPADPVTVAAYERSVRDALAEAGDEGSFTVRPATTHADRFVVEMIHPREVNAAVLGFDLGSDQARRDAIEAARDRGDVAVTRPLVLVQADDVTQRPEDRSVLLVVPMYETDTVPVTAPARRRHHAGSVSFALHIPDLIASLSDKPLRLELSLYDIGETAGQATAPGDDDRLYRSTDDAGLAWDGAAPLRETLDLDVGGRRWRLVVLPGEGYPTDNRWLVPLLAALVGLSATIATAGVLLGQTTGRERAEALVTSRTLELQTLLANAPDPTLVVDDTGLITYVSQQVSSLLGYDPDELLGQSVDRLVVADMRARHVHLRRSFHEDQGDARAMARTRDVQALHRDGHTIEVDVSLSALPAIPGVPGGKRVIASLRDVTERRDAVRRAAELDQQRTTFIRTVSHELRTPLTSIDGFVSILRQAGDQVTPDERADYLERIHRNTAGLRRLIEEVIDFSQLERQGRAVHPEATDLGEFARLVIEQLGPVLETHHVVVDAPAQVLAMVDAHACTRICSNLLVNAVRYSPPGSTVTVGVGESAEGPFLDVSDQGPGVPEADRERVFERFWRGEGAHVLRAPGTGVGLAVVAELATAHGGRVEVGDAPGGGARFVVWLPGVDAAMAGDRIEEPDATSADGVR